MELRKVLLFTLAVFLPLVLGPAAARSAIRSPEDYFGHAIGADRKLVRHDKLIEYLQELAVESPRVRYEQIGTSTLGKPIALALVSTERNMAGLQRYREISRRLSDPRLLDRQETLRLAEEGKIFLLVLCNQHSTEIASSNMAVQLVYDLAASADPRVERALQEVIVMVVPSANPDGQHMVVDYYNEWMGTPYEGSGLPWLYHHYAGHDDNRDWFVLNLAETDALVEVMYGRWYAQVMVDVHQMGMAGVRMFVPPFYDPPNPNNHPLIWSQIELVGAWMKQRLAEAGKKGVISYAYYSGWYQGSVRPNATQHNITALLTESASAQVASPVYVDPAELQGTDQGLPEYEQKMNFTDPWPGGWWRLRDIVEYQLVALKGMIEACASNRFEFLRNYYDMAAQTLELPEHGAPYAYLVPPDQPDRGSTYRMLKIFERTHCEMHRARQQFTADGRLWPAGTIVLKVGQPYGRFVKDLLERKLYPDLRKYPGGPPVPPYDNAAWTVSLMMGVEAVEIARPFQADLELLDQVPEPPALEQARPSLLDCRDNNSFKAVNLLLGQKEEVSRILEPVQAEGRVFPSGSFLVRGRGAHLTVTSREARVEFVPAPDLATVPKQSLRPGRIGLYSGWVPSMDEGWTRLVLDNFHFDYEKLDNERLRKGNLIRDWAVIILPSLSKNAIIKGNEGISMPPQYRGGIGEEGVKALEKFVEEGGTLIALREACSLVTSEFEIPVSEVNPGRESEFFCPGSLLEIEVDPNSRIGFGMPERTACFFVDGVLLATSPPAVGGPDRRVVARYGRDDILLSGWLLGEDKLRGMPAVVEVSLGKGSIVLCGFGVQNRAQTWGTFKLLFNAIYSGFK
ncbi:MAG: M14 metallopeptidase family protein [Candidatus Glassbacteria bacterium]